MGPELIRSFIKWPEESEDKHISLYWHFESIVLNREETRGLLIHWSFNSSGFHCYVIVILNWRNDIVCGSEVNSAARGRLHAML